MSATVTLAIPEPVLTSARAIATQTQRRVEDVLLEWLDRAATATPIELLPDAEVLAVRDAELDAATQRRLSTLLERQREGELTAADATSLNSLMRQYRQALVRKAQAVAVAVDRGLQPPLV